MSATSPSWEIRSVAAIRLDEHDLGVTGRTWASKVAPTPTPQPEPVTHASRLVAQDIAPLVAFGLGPGILAAGPATYRHYSYSGRLCEPDLNSWSDQDGGRTGREPPAGA